MDESGVDRKPKRLLRWVLIGLALAVLLVGAVLAVQGREEASAEEVATSFLAAYGDFDAERAIDYLADDADISQLIASVGASGAEGTLTEFRLLVSLLEAQGYRQLRDSCEELGNSAAGTRLRCSFDFHILRSDEIGRGPFGGSYLDLTVRDGEIVRASKHWALGEFSPQLWEPFAAWVSRMHPRDVSLMYRDGTYSGTRLTEESIRLWERHTRGYVDEVAQSGDVAASS